MDAKSFGKYFDHTLLKPDATVKETLKLFEDAVRYGFFGVCIDTCHVPLAYRYLKDTPVKIVTVTGFPLGSSSTEAKLSETRYALENGAEEIDTVINIGALKDKDNDYILKELSLLSDTCHISGASLKVILETCLLTDEEIITACSLAENAGADFIKTSTGFSTGGAMASDVKLIRDTVGKRMKIKASGGIKTLASAIEMIEAGADRLGCSSSVSIMEEYIKNKKTT